MRCCARRTRPAIRTGLRKYRPGWSISMRIPRPPAPSEPHRIAQIQTGMVDIDAHAAPARAAAILSGLGFPAADQARPVAEFSGGWRMRVGPAATLFAPPGPF